MSHLTMLSRRGRSSRKEDGRDIVSPYRSGRGRGRLVARASMRIQPFPLDLIIKSAGHGTLVGKVFMRAEPRTTDALERHGFLF